MILYNKLSDYLKKKNLRWIDLQKELNLSPTVVAKFQKNRNCTTETINKVCEYLKVQPGDIMEWISDAEYEKNKNNKEKAKIQAQIEQLQKQLEEIQNAK